MDQSLQGAASAVRTIALQMLEERGLGVVLVGVARVDAALERLLQAVLLPTASRSDSLLQVDRPLGSFGARISLAHRLGLIETLVELSLHTLRRVRNAFAHSSDSAYLGDPAHAGRLAQAYQDAKSIRCGNPWRGCSRRPVTPESLPWIPPCGITSC